MCAIDGCKLPSNASKEWSGTIGSLKKKKETLEKLYSRRQQIIEPVFSDITYCKRMNRFTLRGRKKVDIQWKLYCIVHNIGKCIMALDEEDRGIKEKGGSSNVTKNNT
jgi:hypothetical protein